MGLLSREEWRRPEDVHRELTESLSDPVFNKRLLIVAIGMVRGKFFHGRPLSLVAKPSDFINVAICKSLSGERRRMRVNDPDGLFGFLAASIESEISNMIMSKESSSVEAFERPTASDRTTARDAGDTRIFQADVADRFSRASVRTPWRSRRPA